MIFIQCKSAAIKLIVKRISRVFWFCCGDKLQKYQAPVAIKTQCQTKLLTFRLELKWRVWAERQSLALNYEFEWTERQTQLLLKSSVLKNKKFDWGMCKRGGTGEEKCETTDRSYLKTRIATEYESASKTRKRIRSWMTISHSPFIIRSSQAWWPVIRRHYHRWHRYCFDFKDVFKGILWGQGSGGGANERQGLGQKWRLSILYTKSSRRPKQVEI